MAVLSAQNLHQSRVVRPSRAPQHVSHGFCGFRKLNAVDRPSTGHIQSLQQKVTLCLSCFSCWLKSCFIMTI